MLRCFPETILDSVFEEEDGEEEEEEDADSSVAEEHIRGTI